MYEKFFKLTSKPFSLVPDPRFLFLSRTHRKALHYLDYGLNTGAGFILLTGEVGSGKTTVVKDFIRRLDQTTELAMIFNTCLDGTELLAAINEEFGLEIKGRDRLSLQREFNDFLIARYSAGIRPILVVDEAQNLKAEALEEIRLLSNLEAADSKLLQIVLIGQPELQDTMDQHSLRQLRQRIGIRCHLGPLAPWEVEEYIFYRLDKAGNREAVSFEPGSMEIIHRHSGGIPRLVNRICDFLLLAAFSEEIRHLPLDLVEEVAAETGDLDVTGADYAVTEEEPAPGELEKRLNRLEKHVADFLSGELQKERIFERLSLLETAVRNVNRKHRAKLDEIENALEKIGLRIEGLEKGKGLSVVK